VFNPRIALLFLRTFIALAYGSKKAPRRFNWKTTYCCFPTSNLQYSLTTSLSFDSLPSSSYTARGYSECEFQTVFR